MHSQGGGSDISSLSFSEEEENSKDEESVDQVKLNNLVKRMDIYGDITQSSGGKKELQELLIRFHNNVPKVNVTKYFCDVDLLCCSVI